MRTKFLLTALAFCSLSSIQAENDPVLMRINGKEIKKSEFEYIYHKNTQQQISEQKSLDEYVKLFVNFKLKVAEAELRGLDTTKMFINELAGYRKQLAQPYLVDRSVDDVLAKEAYNRMLENVEVSHILLRVEPNASEADVRKVYERLMGCKNKILKGYDFNKMAQEISEDPSAKSNGGALGFISAFMTVYPFETTAYNTPVGSVSDPVRTQFGYHLVKVTARRQDQGEFLASHIMKMVPRDATPQAEAAALKEIEELYAQIMQGADFAELAKEKSEDRQSAVKGGELPWFGAGRMVKEFEEAAFALQENGDISKPVRTPYGWHIIKRMNQRGIGSFETRKPEIMKRLARDERANKGQEALLQRLQNEYNVSYVPEGETVLSALTRDFHPVDSVFMAEATRKNAPLLKIADKVYTTGDFARFMKTNRRSTKNMASEMLTEKKEQFLKETLLAYEDTRLEAKYPDFRNLINEYRDGILLFEVSNKEVWEKASADKTGLDEFFKENRNKYKWDAARFKGFVVECKDKDVAKAARKIIKKAPADSVSYYLKTTLNNDSVQFVKVEKGLYTEGDNKVVDAFAFKKGEASVNELFPVAFISGKKLKKGPESYEDVRGLVTSDYQNYLENKWIDSLSQKISVEIEKDVLKTVKPL